MRRGIWLEQAMCRSMHVVLHIISFLLLFLLMSRENTKTLVFLYCCQEEGEFNIMIPSSRSSDMIVVDSSSCWVSSINHTIFLSTYSVFEQLYCVYCDYQRYYIIVQTPVVRSTRKRSSCREQSYILYIYLDYSGDEAVCRGVTISSCSNYILLQYCVCS